MTFLPVPSRNKLLVAPEVFKKVSHRLFPKKDIIEHKDKKWVVLPFDDVTNTLLVRHNLKPPSPIEHLYNWPGRYTPFKHQVETAKFLATYDRCFCFNDMGSGKTLSALWAADYLMSRGVHESVLIISPLSTLERVWGDALYESFHHRKFEVVHGSKSKRLAALNRPADFYVLNHDGLKVNDVYDVLMARKDITLVIVDELAVFRNQKSKRYKALWNVAGPDSGRSVWGLTGAPMPTGPTDVWAQARLINPSLVPKYFNRFRNEMMVQVTQFKWVPKKNWEDKCYSMLKPSIRYSTEECLDLPPISYITHEVGMSKEQSKVYDKVYKTCVAEAAEGQIVALNEGAKLMKLLQIATGAVYTSDKDVVDLAPTPKLSELTELIYETNKKCIVFTPFIHSIEMLGKHLKKSFTVAKIHGGTSAKKRNEIFSEFQHGELEVLLAHPQCMAHGVTLTAASNIIWFAPIDNYEIYEQANARVRRAGQKSHQNIIHLQCSKIEQRVYDRLKSKEQTQGVLLELLGHK
jgi:SNF2 family DNA or RNA helicase